MICVARIAICSSTIYYYWKWASEINSKIVIFQLTAEDEERRRRRRERNKIAATKCRLKKRERTANLVQESETLETQNVDLKNQIRDLQNQKQSLLEILAIHKPQCQHNIGKYSFDNCKHTFFFFAVKIGHNLSNSHKPSFFFQHDLYFQIAFN